MRVDEEIKDIDVCLVCNPGGHLQSMKFLKEAYYDSKYSIITHESITTEDLERTVFFKKISFDSHFSFGWLLQLLFIMVDGARLFIRYRPEIAISTGGYLAAPTFYILYIFGCDVVFIENISRRTSRSLSGRLVYPICDRFFVQHEETLQLYGEKAEYHGSIL